MRLFSKKNIEPPFFYFFEINILLPTFKRIKEKNTYEYDSCVRGFDIKLNTQIIYRREDGFYYFEAVVLGFGVLIRKQDGY